MRAVRRAGARFCAGVLVVGILMAPWVGASGASLLEGRVIDRTLDNGMRVLLVERPAVPTVSYNIAFRVGSVNERTGESGLAHLFEHMAFKGTTTLGTKDFERERPLLDELDRIALEIQREESRGAAVDAERVASLRQRFEAVQDEARALVVP